MCLCPYIHTNLSLTFLVPTQKCTSGTKYKSLYERHAKYSRSRVTFEKSQKTYCRVTLTSAWTSLYATVRRRLVFIPGIHFCKRKEYDRVVIGLT